MNTRRSPEGAHLRERITTAQLHEALDRAAQAGLCARDIQDVRVEQGRVQSIMVVAAAPKQPDRKFTLELRVP